MVSMPTLNVVDLGVELWSGEIKDYKIGTCICFFSTAHTVLMSKNKDWLAWNLDNEYHLMAMTHSFTH
jgi:hypothetical protein